VWKCRDESDEAAEQRERVQVDRHGAVAERVEQPLTGCIEALLHAFPPVAGESPKPPLNGVHSPSSSLSPVAAPTRACAVLNLVGMSVLGR